MSNSLAIAAVTSTIRFVLESALQAPHPGPVGGAVVTTLRPDRLVDSDLTTPKGINVYLYDVRPNHAWNLTDLPTRREDGSLVRRPVAALDLYYLLTCYGEEEALDAQRLLGRAVLALAVTPILTRDVVAAAMRASSLSTDAAFPAESDLLDQVERVKVAPLTPTLEEMEKLWGMFQTQHQLSQTYLATAVLLEADVSPRKSLPVRRRVVAVAPGGSPRLASLVTDPPGGFAVNGDVIAVEGTGLLAPPGAATVVRVGPTELEPAVGANALRIEFTLNDAVPAGLRGVRVVHRQPAAGVAPARIVATSNTVPLLVRPTIVVVSGPPNVVLEVSPPLQPGQRPTVLLTRLVPGPADAADAVTIRLDPVPNSPPPPQRIEIPAVDAADLPAGDWLVRIQIDGVESIPELVEGIYRQPSLTVR